jgi:hypothetical protein
MGIRGKKPTAVCEICASKKPVDLFTAPFKGKYRVCKECKTHLNRMNRFGLTPKDYENLLKVQDYKCAICESPLTFVKNSAVVDHCHGTNKIRGILCRSCNTGLGSFKDEKSFLAKAIYYLERPIAAGIAERQEAVSPYDVLREHFREKNPPE